MSSSKTTRSAAARKQALQDQVLALIQDQCLAGIALTMGLGKTLIGLRDMDRLLAAGQFPDQAAGKHFLVAAPTQTILDSWSQEAQKFGLAHLLDHIEFTTYRSLAKALAAGTYQKLYLDECHALKDSHEPGLKAHAAKKRSILGLTGTPPAQANSEKGRLVATYCPIVVDYTTDEAVLAGLQQPVHHQRARELLLLEQAPGQCRPGPAAHRDAAHPAHAGPDELPG
jgi:superfamily II DNA or RNA helicase